MTDFVKPCYIHNGAWKSCAEHAEAYTLHCECIHRYDDYEMPNTPLIGIVPGGTHKDSHRKAQEKQISRNLSKYKGARTSGLRPEQPTERGVDVAEATAEMTERAQKVLDNQ